MKAILMAATVLATTAASADELDRVAHQVDASWNDDARFFMGFRGGVGIPPGATGVAPNAGLELGVAAPKGIGFGLHLLGMANPPSINSLGIPKTDYGFGAAADIRFYFQTVEPLTLYPTLSLGFLAGQASGQGTNVVLPLINPGFGARMTFQNVYFAFEMGAASFFIPYATACVGWHFDRQPRARATPIAETTTSPETTAAVTGPAASRSAPSRRPPQAQPLIEEAEHASTDSEHAPGDAEWAPAPTTTP